MSEFETILYQEKDHVAWITLNRPEVHNAFNMQMCDELSSVWRGLRSNDDVHVAVLTGAGERAFCTGIDRMERNSDAEVNLDPERSVGWVSHLGFNDPGRRLSPKMNDLWKPVIAAVNGMACGGAFYMLGDVDIIIAADHAMFFDPHVTYNMASAFEPIHMLQRMPLGEIMRLTLAGNYERMSAQRAFDIGLVSEICPKGELHERASWLAEVIAEAHPASTEGSVRAIWLGQELSRRQALEVADLVLARGNVPAATEAGQERFASGKRVEWKLR